ncbi:C39 family peptidase [Aquisalimonas lutea]|uniref:C39 family peptidase n=1 Tax=Aquisalimonas lutea TaxID=1327750 RepID=UPI0025B362ED|nr:C39 family peptidase [Aquisalimonas lutea]MDN3516978.1 C39 family peptidase [Aquisalimonas lutea]
MKQQARRRQGMGRAARMTGALLALALLAAVVAPVQAQTTPARVPTAAGALHVPVVSMTGKRWERVIRQQYDYSCGSAAVATLLTYHYGIPRTEAQVFETMYAVGNQELIRAQGFSMLDLKRYLDAHGLNADGFRMTLDQLAGIGAPAIVLVNTGGYQHFIVVKGIRGDEVIVGDPAGGTVIVPRAFMEAVWNGIVLAGRGRLDTAREHFNLAADWAVRPAAPIGRSARSMAALPARGVTLPGINEFGR